MLSEFTQYVLHDRISKNVSDERNPVIRMVPLFIKKAAMFIAYMKCGESTFTMPFSNLGRITLPEIMYEHIERIDFISGAKPPLQQSKVSTLSSFCLFLRY